MNCINKNSKEFKELEGATGFSPFLLNRIITNYQGLKGTDAYPSLEYVLLMGDTNKSQIANSIDNYALEQHNNIEDSNVDVLFVSGISDNLKRSVELEKVIRKELIPIADELDVPIKFISDRKSTSKIRFVNGEIRVNLIAINESDDLAKLKKPLLAALADKNRLSQGLPSVSNLESSYNESNVFDNTRVVMEVTVNTEDSISTVAIEDLVDSSFIIDPNNPTEVYLIPYSDEATRILGDGRLSEAQKFNQLRAKKLIAEVVKDDNYSTILKATSQSESGLITITNQSFIESEYDATENALDLAIRIYDHVEKGIFNLSNDKNNKALFDTLENLSEGTVTDIYGNKYPSDTEITTYESEVGPIRYVTNEEGNLVMLKEGVQSNSAVGVIQETTQITPEKPLDAEVAALEQQPTSAQKADILQKKEERLANVKPVYHHTTVDAKDFNFDNFQRGKEQVSQFGDGLNASSNTTSFLASRYGKPIQGEVNDADFVKIDASKTQKEVYEELKKQGYTFSEVHDDNDVLSEVPGAAMMLFTDFQKSNPNVKGVQVSNHIIGNNKVAPFYVIYDAKSFYGQGALSEKIEQESNAELAALGQQAPETYLQLASEIVEPAIEELDKFLLDFLKAFNVKSKQFEELKSRLGVDALGATDVLNKLIWYVENRNEETLPEEAAHMIVALMGENHPEIKELLVNITNWSEYESIKNEYLPIYNDEGKVKIEAVGKLIAKALVKNYKANGLDNNKLRRALNNIIEAIKRILDSINLGEAFRYNESIADKIAINVLSGNKDYIYKIKNLNPNVNAKNEIDNNPNAKAIINTFSSNNVKMTGSLAIAGTENIRRPEGQGIHDIDFKVKSFDAFENEVMPKLPENAVPAHFGWHKKAYSTFAYLVPLKGYRIEVLERKDGFSNGFITNYALYDENNNQVEITQQNVIGVDFFVYKDGVNVKDFDFTSEYIPASLVYEGKISLGGKTNPYFFSRDKDQEDYVLRNPQSFIPFSDHIYYQLSGAKGTTQSTQPISDSLPFSEYQIDNSNDVEVYPFGSLVFKTLEERERYVNRISSLQGINNVVLNKFRANNYSFEGLSTNERKQVREILEKVGNHAKNTFIKKDITTGQNNDDNYKNSTIGRATQRISNKAKNSKGGLKSNRRSLSSVATEPFIEEVVKVAENAEKRGIDELSTDIEFQIRALNELYKANAKDPQIESQREFLADLLFEYSTVVGRPYVFPRKRGIHKDILSLTKELAEEAAEKEKPESAYQNYKSYTLDPKLEVKLTNISRNISENQKKVLEKYGAEYSGVYGKIRNKKYAITSESKKEAQSKIDIMSKALDANIIWDESLEAKAVLLSVNSYQAIQAKKRGDTRPIIMINPNLLSSDTVIQEFAHLYIELLGENDPLVQKAINMLIGTDLYTKIGEQYPELVGIALDKEVLATALGMEGDMIFKRSIEKLTTWQSIKRAILDAMRAIFNMSNDSLEQLAKEVLGKRKSRVKPGTVYSSTINYFSKYKVDTSKNIQEEVKRLFDELTSNSTLNEDTHRYTVDNQEYITSITGVVKQMMNRKFNAKNKGSRELVFNKDDYDKDLILHKLDAPKIPAALANALDDYIAGKVQNTSPVFLVKPEENHWSEVYAREMEAYNLSEKTSVEANMIKALTSGNSTFKDAIIKDYDKIIEHAVKLQEFYNSSSIMGNIVHNAVEKFIKSNGTEDFPANISNVEEFRNVIIDITDKGTRNGSIFFSEQIVFDDDTKSPGTADLIEITKDGKFKIYDFKTIASFKDKKTGEPLSDYNLYYLRGYVNQLMSYGEILKKYGIEAHEDPYHIIMTEVSHTNTSNIVKDLSGEITLGDVKVASIKNLSKLSNKYRQTNTQVRRYFQNKKVSNINLKAEIKDVEDAVDRVYHTVSKFNKSLKKISQDTNVTYDFSKLDQIIRDNADDDAIRAHGEEVKYEYKRYISKNNKLIINKFLDQVHSVMGDLNDFHNDGTTETSSQYLRSLNYVLQLAESLYDIKRGLTPEELTKNDIFTVEEAAEVETKINETIDAIIKNRSFYKSKLIQNALYTLATNSNMQEGSMIEKLQIEARKVAKQKGVPATKDYVTRYVQERIRDKKDLLENNEIEYWTAQYENGILDLRLIEAWIADPGMIDSQIIQIVKQMMDSNELFVRQQMMELAPELNEWYKGSSRGSGNTRQQWKKFLTKSKVYIGETDSYELIEDGGVIPEFVSDYYYDKLIFENEKRNLNRKKKHILNNGTYNKEVAAQIDEINNELDKLIDDFKISQKVKRRNDSYSKTRVNPDFAKLSPKEQEDLRFIHKNLREADDRVDDVSKKLSLTVNGITIYNLPRQRMGLYEAGLEKGVSAFTSSIKDVWRPPADEDSDNITNEEREINHAYEAGTSITDLKGNQHLEVPVFYRNELEDPRLQSFDIPTLLLENHQSTLSYQQATAIEADLFVIKESVNPANNDKILNVDAFSGKLVKDVSNIFKQKSTNSNLYKALSSSIDLRLAKRAYMGTYGNANYKLIKGMEYLRSYTTVLGLSMNFKSLITTSMQGSVYRTMEGIVGEHFNMTDWAKGTAKAYRDMPGMIADTQKYVQDSKTNLLIKYFGMEQRETVLSNKFVQSNILKKNLDSAALYAVTSIGESTVTAMLMYSMLNNVKVMDKDQNYIDKDGNIVKNPKDAMSLDEAYTVKNGKLVLHPKVVYTNRDFVNKYRDGNQVVFSSVTAIGSNMDNTYANLYGQYQEQLKTMAQRTAIGKMAFSMKGWLVRGMHQRWRGVTSAIPIKSNFLSFEDLRDDKNIDQRFYSQASKSFHEGYHATSLRYILSVAQKMKDDLSMAAFSDVYSDMTTHERANLKRSLMESAVVIASYLLYTFVAAMAKAYDDEDKDASERFYFTAYMVFRLHDELATFSNPKAMIDMVTNPMPAFNTINNMIKLLKRLVGFDYVYDEGFDWSINDEYEKGDKKGQLKLRHDVMKFIPGVNNTLQGLNVFGLDTGKSMKDQFKGQMMSQDQ